MDLEPIWAGDKQAIRLAMGELSAQEMRSVLALLNLLRPDHEKLKHKLREYSLELLALHDQALLTQMAYLKQQGRCNEFSRTGREGSAVGDGPADHPQQQSDSATHEDNVGVG
jgi:hypothetical protein